MYEVYFYHAQIKELCRCYRPCVCMLCSSFSRLVYTVGYVIMSNHPQHMHTYTTIHTIYNSHTLFDCKLQRTCCNSSLQDQCIAAMQSTGFSRYRKGSSYFYVASTTVPLSSSYFNILRMSRKRLGGGHFFCFAACLAASSCSLYRCVRKQYKVGVYFLSCGLFQHHIINPRCACAAGLQQFVVFAGFAFAHRNIVHTCIIITGH